MGQHQYPRFYGRDARPASGRKSKPYSDSAAGGGSDWRTGRHCHGIESTVRGILDPIIEIYRPVPPLAYLPLMIIWFGIGETSKILLIYLAILPQ